jgi:hypothetical protein
MIENEAWRAYVHNEAKKQAEIEKNTVQKNTTQLLMTNGPNRTTTGKIIAPPQPIHVQSIVTNQNSRTVKLQPCSSPQTFIIPPQTVNDNIRGPLKKKQKKSDDSTITDADKVCLYFFLTNRFVQDTSV